jgi:hypothetical protein
MIIKIPNTKLMAKEDNGNLGPGIGYKFWVGK